MPIGERTLNEVMPADPDQVAGGWHYLRNLPKIAGPFPNKVQLLDLGAGNGASKRIAESAFGADGVDWTGVDIGDSAEHLARKEDSPHIDVYNGTELPYDSERFDVIWCQQVLEHVRYPDKVIAEVARTLKPGGYFIGSVSQLEPYHSRSIFNWTHYGIRVVFGDHKLKVKELRPGADGILLMMRAVFGYNTGLNTFFSKESPFQSLVKALFTSANTPASQNAAVMYRHNLKTAGHIHFLAQKEGRAAG